MISLFFLYENGEDPTQSGTPVYTHNETSSGGDETPTTVVSVGGDTGFNSYDHPDKLKNLPPINAGSFGSQKALMQYLDEEEQRVMAGWRAYNKGLNPEMEDGIFGGNGGGNYMKRLAEIRRLRDALGGVGGEDIWNSTYKGTPPTPVQKAREWWDNNKGTVGLVGLAGAGAGAYYLKNKKQQEGLQGSSVSNLFRR